MSWVHKGISPAHSKGFNAHEGKCLLLAEKEYFLQLSLGMGTGPETALGLSPHGWDAAHRCEHYCCLIPHIAEPALFLLGFVSMVSPWSFVAPEGFLLVCR